MNETLTMATTISNLVNNQDIPGISSGILLLNQFSGNLISEDVTHRLNGTLVVKCVNSTISMNFHFLRNFCSSDSSTILQLLATESEFHEKPLLEMMKELNINNTKEIQLLQSDPNIHGFHFLQRFITYSFNPFWSNLSKFP